LKTKTENKEEKKNPYPLQFSHLCVVSVLLYYTDMEENQFDVQTIDK